MDISTLLKEGEEVVISGIGGRFPESDTVDEFAQNLYNKVDMITVDDRRWPTGQKNLS
jgi:fatty acid synthase